MCIRDRKDTHFKYGNVFNVWRYVKTSVDEIIALPMPIVLRGVQDVIPYLQLMHYPVTSFGRARPRYILRS